MMAVQNGAWSAEAQDVRDLAKFHLLQYLDDVHQSPTALHLLAKALSIRLLPLPFWNEPSYDGSCFFSDDGYRLVVYNTLLRPTRRAFTIAHEIGHLVLQHYPPRRWVQERLASIYASEVLMPAERLKHQIEQFGPDVRHLAYVNGVSISAMQRRLHELAPTIQSKGGF